MKRILIVAFMLIAPSFLVAQTVIEPTIGANSSFAIVIDSKSYEKTRDAVEAYRDVVEADGLATYIIHENWGSPKQIRELLQELYNNKKSPLEGAVFVGDIPIPMLRDAQHLTSAFKMDQDRDWQRSSIPSDRYYDDFDLQWDFIMQDSLKGEYFYYSLRGDSPQELYSEIYTARIRPLRENNGDIYEQLENYLRKVVAERSENPNNILDNLSMARGHGYNSESKVAWAGEQLALLEQFPQLFAANSTIRFMDFDQNYPAKPNYINEITRPELDVMLFHHHGMVYYQVLNGYKSGSSPTISIDNVRLYLRSKIRSAVERGATKDEAIKDYMEYLDVPRSWCEDAFDPDVMEADSLFNLSLDILVSDILAFSPNARFVMFDACYNGSFHADENVAGAYIFNDGKTIVTQGNTVNAIQDKWPDEFLGLLAGGIRVGQWGRHVQFLETHIIGDPTYRFENTALDFDINKALTQKKGDAKLWLKLTEHPSVDVQAMAYKKLYLNNYPAISNLLKEAYFTSQSGIVRLEALMLLGRIDDSNFIEVLKAAVNDGYELVRRFAVEYICKNSSDELIPAFTHSLILDNTSERVAFKHNNFVKLLDLDKLEKEIDRQLEELNLYDSSKVVKFKNDLQRYRDAAERDMATIKGKDSEERHKIRELRMFRNHPNVRAIDDILAFASDSDETVKSRVVALEALGWYNLSYQRDYVVSGLEKILNSATEPEVIKEAQKSINRLKR